MSAFAGEVEFSGVGVNGSEAPVRQPEPHPGGSGDGDETAEEFDYFAHCVLTETPPEPDGRDGLTDVAVSEAVYEAAETGDRTAVERY